MQAPLSMVSLGNPEQVNVSANKSHPNSLEEISKTNRSQCSCIQLFVFMTLGLWLVNFLFCILPPLSGITLSSTSHMDSWQLACLFTR